MLMFRSVRNTDLGPCLTPTRRENRCCGNVLSPNDTGWLETMVFVPQGCCNHGHFICIHPHGFQKVKAPRFCLWFRFHVHQYGGPSSRSWHSPYEFPKDHMCINGKHETGWLSLVAQACPCPRPFIPFWRLFPNCEHTGHLEALVVRIPSLSSWMLLGS